jgi:hypothetical protein
MIINSYFTFGGGPATGLTPTIKVWEVVSGAPITYVLVVNNASVTVGNSDGFYSYDFSIYDPAKNYLVRVDGGTMLPPNERYSVATVEASAGTGSYTIQDIVDGVWDEPASSHITAGTMGVYQNETHADVQQLRVDVTTALSVLDLLLKYESNYTKIDKAAYTLTVYDDDKITALRVFALKDSTGAPSVTEVCIRDPI